MSVPFCDLAMQNLPLRDEMVAAFDHALSTSEFTVGDQTDHFEEQFAQMVGAQCAVAVSNGTDAIYLSLLAQGIGAGDEVIVPALTFTATAATVEWCGARPIFADINDTGCICPQSCASLITPRTRAIIPVHLYGQPAAMDEIMVLAEQHHLCVIEDASQSHLARFQNQYCGTFGSAATFSFYPSKNLSACGEGGIVVTNNLSLAEKIRGLRSWSGGTHSGVNARMHGLQAAILSIKLPHLPAWNKERRQVAHAYHKRLNKMDIPTIRFPRLREDVFHVFNVLAILAEHRTNYIAALEKEGIGYRIHYAQPLPLQECFIHYQHKKGEFPVAELFASQEISLPIFPEMTTEQIDTVCGVLQKATIN